MNGNVSTGKTYWSTCFKSENKIDAFILRTDPLNKYQNFNPIMPNVKGKRIYITPRDLMSILNGHSIDSILKYFGVDPEE